jgi:uncharacterized protein YkwD
MICSALTALSIFAGVCSDAVPQTLATTPPSFNAELARDLINKHREGYGLAPVSIDERLMSAAKAHSADMSQQGRISHKGSDGSTPKDRARAFGYNPRLASENVAAGYNNTSDVIKDWTVSKGHNANLLRRGAKHMGMALVYNPKAGKQTYWTLLMGVPR